MRNISKHPHFCYSTNQSSKIVNGKDYKIEGLTYEDLLSKHNTSHITRNGRTLDEVSAVAVDFDFCVPNDVVDKFAYLTSILTSNGRNLPLPTYIVYNTESGHSHFEWYLKDVISIDTQECRDRFMFVTRCLNVLMTKGFVQGDFVEKAWKFNGRNIRNPFYNAHDVYYSGHYYTIDELFDAARASEIGDGYALFLKNSPYYRDWCKRHYGIDVVKKSIVKKRDGSANDEQKSFSNESRNCQVFNIAGSYITHEYNRKKSTLHTNSEIERFFNSMSGNTCNFVYANMYDIVENSNYDEPEDYESIVNTIKSAVSTVMTSVLRGIEPKDISVKSYTNIGTLTNMTNANSRKLAIRDIIDDYKANHRDEFVARNGHQKNCTNTLINYVKHLVDTEHPFDIKKVSEQTIRRVCDMKESELNELRYESIDLVIAKTKHKAYYRIARYIARCKQYKLICDENIVKHAYKIGKAIDGYIRETAEAYKYNKSVEAIIMCGVDNILKSNFGSRVKSNKPQKKDTRLVKTTSYKKAFFNTYDLNIEDVKYNIKKKCAEVSSEQYDVCATMFDGVIGNCTGDDYVVKYHYLYSIASEMVFDGKPLSKYKINKFVSTYLKMKGFSNK